MASDIELKASCMCGAATHSFSVPLASLPLPTHLCSCNISRRTSGSLLTSYVDVAFEKQARPDLTALTPYESSSILTRHFCSTCGTHLYLEYRHDGHFEVATGTLQLDNTDGIIDVRDHMWIGDTLDGGAAQFLTKVEGRMLPRFLGESRRSDEVPLTWRDPSVVAKKLQVGERLHAHCHCKGVQFWIARAGPQSTHARSPWPDLLVPYFLDHSANPDSHCWWLPQPDKFLAGTCACHSCRRSSGFELTFWAFVPTVDISLDADGMIPFRATPYWGTMKSYRSSDNVTRTFCGTCGANVFWNGDERPSLVDVAVGLLRANTGSCAEGWLAWWPQRVSFREDAVNLKLIQGLEEGLKEWALRNDGCDFVAGVQLPTSSRQTDRKGTL